MPSVAIPSICEGSETAQMASRLLCAHLGDVESDPALESHAQRQGTPTPAAGGCAFLSDRGRVFSPPNPTRTCKVHDHPCGTGVTAEVFPAARPSDNPMAHDRVKRRIEGLEGGDREKLAAQNLQVAGAFVQEADECFDLGQLRHD